MKAVKRAHGSAGAYLLEYAVALPLLLTLTLGALDTARVLQVKSAVTKAAETAVRCVYTLDGGVDGARRCIDTSAAPPTALYNWYRITTPPRYEVDRYDYDGEASWFDRKRETYTNMTARILSDYRFSVQRQNLQARLVSYPIEAQGEVYVKNHHLPYISGDPLNPTFRYRFEPGASVAPRLTVSSGLSLSAPSGGSQSRTVTFRITRPFANPNALKARIKPARYDRTPPYSIAADHFRDAPGTDEFRFSELEDESLVMFHIRGNGIGAGRVAIDLSWSGGGRGLGGRVFGSSGPANFVPRGAVEAYTDPELWGGGYREFEDHSSIKVPFNRDITLRFTLSADAGQDAGWNLSNIRLWTPEYARISRNDWRCSDGSGTITRGQHFHNQATGAAVECSLGIPSALVEQVSVRTASPIYSNFASIGCGFGLENAQVQVAQSHGDIEVASYDYDVSQSCQSLVVQSAPNVCGAFGQTGVPGGTPNYGVPQLAGAEGRIWDSSQARSICPAQPTEDMQRFGVAVPTTVSWGERTVTVMDPAHPGTPLSFTHLRQHCEDNAGVAPALLPVPAAKRGIPAPTLTDEPLYTSDQDPRVMAAQQPGLYSCAQMPIASRTFGEETRPELPITSIFRGVYEDIGDGCWEDRLQTEARNLGLPVAAYFEGARGKRSPVVYESMPATQCGASVRIRYEGRGDEELVTHEPVRGRERPSECASPAVCRTELVGFEGGQYSGPVEDFDAAASMGLSEIESVFPAAVRCPEMGDSAEPNCVDVQVVGQDAALGRSYSAQAQAEVPLRLFFGRTLRVSSSSAEVAERAFAR